jgi:hypothetical protein
MSLNPRSNRWRFVTMVPMFALAACAGSTETPGGGGGASAGNSGTAGAGAGGNTTAGGTGGSTGTGTGGSTVTGAGGANRPGTGGMVGGGGSGMGGATGPVGGFTGTLIWPNDVSKANSDTWLVQNHDQIAQLQPRVLVIDLENTANSATLINQHIAALKEATSFHKFKNAAAQPTVSYQLVKTVQAPKGTGTTVNYTSWNTQAFADSNLQIPDPANPTGPNLTLCGLFEKGVINEVWCMASTTPKCGETQESKQAYDMNNNKVANKFVSASNGDSITNLGCKVTVRITDFNSSRGAGCHQHAMGHAWERYMDAQAVPALRKQAARFLNWDLDTRGAPFTNFYSACNSNSTQLTNCIVWNSMINAASGTTASRVFNIPDMSGGCGNAHFYPNTTGTYSYDATTPDPVVLSSCENYGMHNGPSGTDQTTMFTNAMTDTLYGRSTRTCPTTQPACDDDCGGHGTTYLYQNFPGPGTLATNSDATPMHDWWVYLFY